MMPTDRGGSGLGKLGGLTGCLAFPGRAESEARRLGTH